MNPLLQKYLQAKAQAVQQKVGQFAQNAQQFAPQAFKAVTNPVGFAAQQVMQQPQIRQLPQQAAQAYQQMKPQIGNAYNTMRNTLDTAPVIGDIRKFNRDQFGPSWLSQVTQEKDNTRQAELMSQVIGPGSISQTKGVQPGKLMVKLKGKIAPSMANAASSIQQAVSNNNPLRIRPQPGKIGQMAGQSNIPSEMDDILQSGYKEIGSLANEPKKNISQRFDEFYTNWVDRFNPIAKAVGKVEKLGKEKGFELIPSNNPKYTLKRFLGMGSIAEQRYQTDLKPVLSQIDELGIPQQDIDLYLKSRRDINLGQRGIKGSDTELGMKRAQILEQKYGEGIKQVSSQLYKYQSQGFEELAESGFFDPAAAQAIRQKNADYVPFQRVMDELDEFLGMPAKSLQQGKNPIQGIKGSDKAIYSPLESVIANTFKQRAAIEKNNVVKSIIGLQGVMPEIGFTPVSKASNNTLTVWQNGQKQYWDVGPEIAEAAKGLNEESMNSFLKVLTIPAQILRQGATGANPEFMIPNMIRDQFDAAINAKYGYTPFLDWAKGLAHMLKKDDIYQGWVISGGKQSFSSMSGRKGVQEMMNEKTLKKRVIPQLFSWVGKGVDAMGALSEQPTRVGLFANAYKKTGNQAISAFESREGTLDFSRMGSKMKVANSIIPFLNVGIQGFDRMIRTVKGNPAKTAALLSMYGVAPAAATTLYNTINHPYEYAQIPQFVKDDNFIIVTGKNEKGTVDYVTIPKGNIVRYVANPIENLISYMANTNNQSLMEAATQFISSGLPVVGDGSSLKEVGIKTIGSNLPQAIKPITENMMNRSFYKYDTNKEDAKDIVSPYLNKLPAGDRSYEFTPETYKVIGRALNISPLQIQNFMEGYFAGYTKIPVNIIENLNNIRQGKEVDKNKVPLLRRFIQETYPEKPNSNPSIVSMDQAIKGFPSIKNPERSDVISGASAAQANPVDQTKLDKAKADSKAESELRAQVRASGQRIETSEAIYFKDGNEVRKVDKQDLARSDAKAEYSLSVDRLKRTGQYSELIQLTQDRIKELETYKSTLDPRLQSAKATSTQNTIEDLRNNLKSYEKKLKPAKGKGKKAKKMPTLKLKIPKSKKIKTRRVKLAQIKFSKPKESKKEEIYISTI